MILGINIDKIIKFDEFDSLFDFNLELYKISILCSTIHYLELHELFDETKKHIKLQINKINIKEEFMIQMSDDDNIKFYINLIKKIDCNINMKIKDFDININESIIDYNI